ncbi:MAG: hypothetical protein ACTSU2_08050 [Promethearchaeota archaeon]
MGQLNDVMLDPVCYLKIIMHTKRFWNDKIPENKRQFIYGVAIGYVEEGVRYLVDYIPLFHSKHPLDFEKKHSIFMKLDKINAELANSEEPDQILALVHSVNEDELNVTEVDKKNQLYLQTAYNANAVSLFVLIPNLAWDFAIETRGYIDLLCTLDMNSIMADLNWDFDEIIDIDDLFDLVRDLTTKKKPIIKEYGEVIINLPKKL